jgi:hypothetical protein
VFKILRSRCDACGYTGDWLPGQDECPQCGEPNVADPETGFQLPLAFNVAVCETCQKPATRGQCPDCGTELEGVDPSPETRARVKALRPLLARAEGLAKSFDEFPAPHIGVTALQAVWLVKHARLPSRARDLVRLTKRIGDFNFSDQAAIGTKTRQRFAEILDEVESVRDEARLLAAFRPQGPAEELPQALSALASSGARVVAAILDVVSTGTFDECAAASARLQDALTPGPETHRLAELLEALEGSNFEDDLDRRASIAIGAEGKYTDELGFVVPALIFSAPGNETQRFAALAKSGGSYLSHLLDTPVEELHAGASVLALFAVQLAMLDRPFEAHRQAELARDLLRSASKVAPDQITEAICLYDAGQGRVFAASERARRDWRLMQLGLSDDPAGAVESLLSAYKRICEGAYREQMRLLIAIRRILTNQELPKESLDLGDIDSYLDGWAGELGSVFRKTADRELRNAIVHEEYEVDGDSLEVVVPYGRVTPDELADAFRRLAGTVYGLDAAIICHRIDGNDAWNAPDWLAGRDNSPARTMMLQMVAAGFGHELVGEARVEDGVLTLKIDGNGDETFQDIGALLASASKLSTGAEVIRATAQNKEVAAVSTAALQAWNSADPIEEDLAMIEVNVDAALRRGVPPAEAIADACALAIRIFYKVDLEAALQDPKAHTPIDRLARRLRRCARFARQHAPDFDSSDQHVVDDLRQASLLANEIVRDLDRLPELGFLMVGVFQWALARGTSLLGFELAE